MPNQNPKNPRDSKPPQTYFCKYLGYAISGIAARSCNYCNLENDTCNHDGQVCVAQEGLALFAQSLAECIVLPTVFPIPSDDLAIAHHNLRKSS